LIVNERNFATVLKQKGLQCYWCTNSNTSISIGL